MSVKVPFRMFLFVCRRLMEPHRIREGYVKNAIVDRNNLFQDAAEPAGFFRRHLRENTEMALATQQNLVGPHGPEGDHSKERIVGDDNPLTLALLNGNVIAKHAAVTLLKVYSLRLKFSRRHLRN